MSGVLLDTTVLIDLSRGYAPTTGWFRRQPPMQLHLSTITIGELFRGAYRAVAGDAGRLSVEVGRIRGEVLARFQGRIIGFDLDSAEIWGRLMGEGETRGARPAVDDAKIAAIALCHGLTVATSNTRHLAPLCPTLDPRTA